MKSIKSASDLGALESVAKHLGELAGLIDRNGHFVTDWFSTPDAYLAKIPDNATQRDAITALLLDIWPTDLVWDNHPSLNDDGKSRLGMKWLQLPGPKKADAEKNDSQSEGLRDGYPSALYLVSDHSDDQAALGMGLTYRFGDKDDPSLKKVATDATRVAAKEKSMQGVRQALKSEASRAAKEWVKNQFVIQPFVYFPLVGMPAKETGYFALGAALDEVNPTNPLQPMSVGLDIHVKAGSRLSSLPWDGIRLMSDIVFRPEWKPPTFQVYRRKGDNYKLLHAPDMPELGNFLDALLKIEQFKTWLQDLLWRVPQLFVLLEQFIAGLRINFSLPEFPFPKFTLNVNFEAWLKELVTWLSQHVPHFEFPHIDLEWLLRAVLSLKLPSISLPGFPEFSLDLGKDIGFSFQIKDKVLVGKERKKPLRRKKKDGKGGSSTKVVLQLGETFGVTEETFKASGKPGWLGVDKETNIPVKPGVAVHIGRISVDGTTPSFDFNPSLELKSIGLDIEGAAGAPLMDVKGVRLAGIKSRLYLRFGRDGLKRWGVAAKLKKIGIPLGSTLKGGGSSNEVAKSLLAGSGGGMGNGKGGTDAVNPEFGLSVAYLQDSRLSVHLYDNKDKPADVVMMPFQRSYGPLHLRKVGVGWEDEKRVLSLIIDGDVTVRTLTVDLEHLSIGIPVQHPTDLSDYQLSLEGIGIQYTGGPLQVSGAFLERKLPRGDNEFDIEYVGAATVKAETWALGALGAYAYMRTPKPGTGGYASMFIFILVETVLGGPPCFFVRGLAGGFGYNRRFTPPKIEQVEHFPLVRALSDPKAIGGPNAGPAEALEILDPYVSPERGEYWFAAGVRFTSFELVDTSALVVVEFGHDLVITVLGLSKLKLPKEGSPIAVVELALEVVLKPSQGTLIAKALLTDNSWVIDRACKLTGGFAFALWFDENPQGAPVGDFVLTIGGYHPHFQPPAHYPKVPRLGFNWPVSDALSIQGEAYFALTPAQVMAGGGLQVLFHKGDLRAWFRAQMDVLIGWDPFHYEALIKVSIGASYRLHLLFVTVTVTVELGCDLEIWGPPMGGEAHVHWFIIGFTVGFGAKRLMGVPAIPWSDFEKRLLPKKNSPIPAVRIEPKSGIAEQVPEGGPESQEKRWIVRPDDFAFSTSSTVPANRVVVENPLNTKRVGNEGVDFSIRPMQLENVRSTQVVWILDLEHEDQSHHDARLNISRHWDCRQRIRSLPQALWGAGPPPAGPAGAADDLLLDGLVTGLSEARPKHPTVSGPPAFAMEESLKRLPLVGDKDRNTLPLGPGATGRRQSPSRPKDALKKIHDTIQLVEGERDELFLALRSLGVDPRTNQTPTGIAKDAARVFEASPMIGVAV